MVRSARWMKMLGVGAVIAVAIMSMSTRRSAPSQVATARAASAPTLAVDSPFSTKPGVLRIDTVYGRKGYAPLIVSSETGSGYLNDVSASTIIDLAVSTTDRARVFNGVISTRDGLEVGDYTTAVTLMLCRDAYNCVCCSAPEITVPVEVHVAPAPPAPEQPGEWGMYQANAAHTGYMPITLELAKFRLKWTWTRPGGGGNNPVVTENGLAYVSDPVYSATGYLRAFDEDTGATVWEQAFANVPSLNPPAVSNGVVYIATTGYQQTMLFALNSRTGASVFSAPYFGGWGTVLAPTILDNLVVTNNDGGPFAYGRDGVRRWYDSSRLSDQATVAIDQWYVYYYDGASMKVYDPANGDVVKQINDPTGGNGYSYNAAPILGAPDHVIALSGSGTDGRVLVDYTIGGAAARWRSARAYVTQPAYHAGVLYAASNNPFSFDAISETTGKVLWSWVPPLGTTDFATNGNVILANNVAIVSTKDRVYAIDLVTHSPVWSAPASGALSLSPRGTLYVSPRYSGNGALDRLSAFGK